MSQLFFSNGLFVVLNPMSFKLAVVVWQHHPATTRSEYFCCWWGRANVYIDHIPKLPFCILLHCFWMEACNSAAGLEGPVLAGAGSHHHSSHVPSTHLHGLRAELPYSGYFQGVKFSWSLKTLWVKFSWSIFDYNDRLQQSQECTNNVLLILNGLSFCCFVTLYR